MKDPRISKTDGKGLLITDVKSEDTGNYTCVASNGLDSDSKTAEVKVVGKLITVNVVKIRTLVACQKGLDKQTDPDCLPQTGQTQIRLFFKKQSDQGLPFC